MSRRAALALRQPVRSLRNGSDDGFGVPANALLGTPWSLALVWMKKDRERRQMAVYWCSQESKMEIPGILLSLRLDISGLSKRECP